MPGLNFKPRLIIFLVGANEIDRNETGSVDTSVTATGNIRIWLESNSETVNFRMDIKKSFYPMAIFKGNPAWDFTHFRTVYFSWEYIDSALQKQLVIAAAFRSRLNDMAALCQKNDILPVFVSRQMVFRDGTQQG